LPGFNALFADGSAQFISDENDEATIRALITRNGGEPLDPSALK
jgi:prepilin-type processing-associated H-X9-DG protein